jgi:tryptophan-rich sensory protein
MSEWFSLLYFVAAVGLIGLSGAFFRPGDWYRSLDKPSWTPPSGVFRPVWTALGAMMALAGWIVWRQEGFGLALAVWSLNLLFAAAWSWFMFDRRRIDLALFDAVAMLVTIIVFIVAAWRGSPVASMLFVPYLLWVTVATALTFSILRRNPSLSR